MSRPKNLVAYCVIATLVAWGVFDAYRGDWFSLDAVVFGLCLGSIIRPLRTNSLDKQIWRAWWSTPPQRLIQRGEFPDLDTQELERLTREWESLGFVQRADFAKLIKNEKAFWRVLEHEVEGAVVELYQHFSSGKRLPFVSCVESFWGEDVREVVLHQAQSLAKAYASSSPIAAPHSNFPDAKQQIPIDNALDLWNLKTHNKTPWRNDSLRSHPRVLVTRLETKSSPSQLWHTHQSRCALINARLNSLPIHNDLIRLMFCHNYILDILAIRRLKTLSLLAMLRPKFMFAPPTPSYYDGELAPLNQS